jgi:hypothetical protein
VQAFIEAHDELRSPDWYLPSASNPEVVDERLERAFHERRLPSGPRVDYEGGESGPPDQNGAS